MIDSPVYPDELEVLPAVLERAGFPLSGLLATHGDWDHLLARLAFPGAAIGCAETTAARLTGEPGAAAARAARVRRRALRRAPRGRSRSASCRRCRCRAASTSASEELELHPTDGPRRRRDGDLGPVGARARRRRLPVAGRDPDALARAGSRSAYLATLARLEPLRRAGGGGRARPRRGARLGRARWRILREDRAYLEALPDAKLPLARRNPVQATIHAGRTSRAWVSVGPWLTETSFILREPRAKSRCAARSGRGLEPRDVGIYAIYWFYVTAKDLSEYGKAKGYDLGQNPTMTLLALLLRLDPAAHPDDHRDLPVRRSASSRPSASPARRSSSTAGSRWCSSSCSRPRTTATRRAS